MSGPRIRAQIAEADRLFTRVSDDRDALYEALEAIVAHHGDYINGLPGEYGVGDLTRAKTALARSQASQKVKAP